MSYKSPKPSKSSKKSSFRVRSPLQDNLLSLCGILSLIILTFAIVCLVLWLLSYTEILDLSHLRGNSQVSEQTQESAAPSVYDALRPIDDGEADTTLEVTRFSGDFSVLRSMLNGLNAPQSYWIELETEIHGSDNTNSQRIRIARNGALFRIQRYRTDLPLSAGLIEEYIYDGTQIAYIDNETKQIKYFVPNEQFTLEALAGIPSLASFNEISDEQIQNASYALIDGKIIYYVQFRQNVSESVSLLQEYWISPESEFVVRCMTYPPTDSAVSDPQNPIYTCELDRMRELTDHEKNTLFEIPQSNE